MLVVVVQDPRVEKRARLGSALHAAEIARDVGVAIQLGQPVEVGLGESPQRETVGGEPAQRSGHCTDKCRATLSAWPTTRPGAAGQAARGPTLQGRTCIDWITSWRARARVDPDRSFPAARRRP